jgi:eukaryotic-like serine/threonine-protein kinase
MPLGAGVRLGPYEITSPLGAGGMGEVYRARDTRLDRTVAIKVLPPHLAASPERRQRFEREARAISALTHPHICVLHDVGRHDGIDFLVMEYLEGETIADRLKKGALPLEQVLRYGIEIAGALDKAHRHGIVHRDLKPGNIMLTKSGAKLLDFGLARLRASDTPVSAASELSALPTGDKPLTAEGSIVGTFQYMAPEQLEGKEPDARADIFAFGAVLHEMATGQRAFKGKSQASLIAAILASEPPPISRLQPLTPPALDRVVATCLAKDPDERWQSAHDLLKELKWIQEGGSAAGVAPVAAHSQRRERIAWAAAVMAAVLAGVFVSAWRDANREPPRTLQSSLLPPAKVTFNFLYGPAVLSPDGRRVAFVAHGADGRNLVWVRPLNGLAAQTLAGTERATYPFWSADSRSLGFFADGKLKKIDASGGPPQVLCDAPQGRGGAWNRDGVIVFSGRPADGLSRVSVSGDVPTVATELDASRHETSHRWPFFLPDGRHFLYTALAAVTPTEADAIFVGALGSNERQRLVDVVRSNAMYAPPGYLLFAREGALVAQPFDAKQRQLTGDSVVVADQVQTFSPVASAAFSTSANGILAYQSGAGGEPSQLVWLDRAGRQTETGLAPGPIDSPRLSHDGRRVAYRVEDRQERGDIWIYDLTRRISSRFTFDPADEFNPVWSPDDTRIVFSSNRTSRGDLYLKAAGGAGADELLFASEKRKSATDWSVDGRIVLFSEFGPTTQQDLWSLSLPDRKATVALQTEFLESGGALSPDGRWMAYHSDEAGRQEVYVQPFPGPGPKWRISREGGTFARWRGDGKELFFVADDQKMTVVEVTAGSTFGAGDPRPLFATRCKHSVNREYDVTMDGQRFLVNATRSDENVAPITLVQNWHAALKQ